MDHDKAARRALLIAKALKHHASVIHNPASIMGNPPPPVARYGMVSPHLTQIAPVARAAGGSADPAFTDADATAQMKYIQDPNIAMPANQVDQDIEGGAYARGGSADPEQAELQRRMQQILRPDSDDPKMVQKFLKAQASYEQPTHERGAYSKRVLPMPAHDVQTTIGPLGNAVPKEAAPLTWNAFHKIGKGGTIFTLGGDRSNLGRLTHINGKPLSWPVDLHAGTKYMAEPNPGAVWANALGAASTLRKNIREAAKKGPVYGAFAPMGPRAVDSSNNMFDALMAQVPTSDISPDDAVKFDKSLQAGEHIKGDEEERAAAQEVMKSWPGIQNAEKARDFASKLSGGHRSAIVKHMEAAPWQKAGFPSVGMTRAAITDPDLLGVAGNLMGHHVVELDPESYDRKNLAFEHSTYKFPTGGKLVGRLPLIERQVAMPDYTDQQVMDKSTLKSGEPTIIHPYSPNAQGRSAYRGNTEMRQAIQPINERMLESIQQTHGTGFADGGEVEQELARGAIPLHPALNIPGVHIRTAEAGHALHLTSKFGNSLPSAVNQAKAATRRRP